MDETTFENFYRKTAQPLWSYIYRVSCDAMLADDILQETYYRFLGANLTDMDEAQMRSYLYKIATNLLYDYWRSKKREQKRLLESSPNGASTTDGDNSRDIEQSLDELTPQERSLLWLAYVEGNEHKEISQVLGLKEKSVRVLLFRARRKLAGILRQKGLGPEGDYE